MLFYLLESYIAAYDAGDEYEDAEQRQRWLIWESPDKAAYVLGEMVKRRPI